MNILIITSKIIKGFAIVFLLFVFCSISMAQVGFEIDINSDIYDELPTNFIRDGNDGYVGMINNDWNGGDIYSISSEGDTMSVSITKNDTAMRFCKIIAVKSNNYSYLLYGHGCNFEGTFTDPFTIFIALDSNLNTVWVKIYEFDFYYSGSSSDMIQLKDSNILYCCAPHLNEYMFLFELSQNGDSLNYRLFTGDSAGQILSITYNSDSSNLLLHTQFAHYDPLGPQSQCITLDKNWNQIEVREYPRWLRAPYTAILIPDARILNGASFRNAYNDIVTAYNINDNPSFDLLNINKLSSADTNSPVASNTSVDYYYPGCYFIGGTINRQGMPGFYPSWYYVAMLNDTMGVEYEKYIGGDEYYWLFSVTATTDGGVMLAGTKHEIGIQPFQKDVYIIKLDSLVYTNQDENSHVVISDAIVYPKPGSENLYIRTALKNCTFLLYSSNGVQQVKKQLNNLITPVKTNKLTSGLYVYKILQNDKLIESGNWIKK